MDIYQHDSEMVIVAQVPGRRVEDLSVELDGDTLSVSSRCSRPARDPGRRLIEERMTGGFLRRIVLPPRFDGGRVTARLADGLLRISVPARAGITMELTVEAIPSCEGSGAEPRAEAPGRSEEGKESG